MRIVAATVVATSIVACASLSGLSGGPGGSNEADGGDASAAEASTGESDGGADAQRGAIESACATAAEAFCSRLAVCDPSSVQSLFGGPSTCTAQVTLLCTTEARAPGSRVTASEIAACSDASVAQPCADRLDGKKPPACEHVGDLEDGQPCIGDSQCKTGYCAGLAGTGCGTCRAPATSGQPCGTGCARGLLCMNGSCSAPRRVNESCTGEERCSRVLQCDGETCIPWLEEGADCGSDLEKRGECDPTKPLVCELQAKRCVKPPVVQPGTECTATNGVRPVCAGGRCAPTPAGPAKCVAWAGLGEPCTDQPCIQPLWCVAGECVLPSQTLCAN